VIWLPDTNTIIYAQHVGGVARQRLDDASGRDRIVTSTLVIAELFYGADRSSRPEGNRRKVQQVVDALEIRPITLSTAARFGVLKEQLASRGGRRRTWISTSLPPRSTLALRWSPTTPLSWRTTSRAWSLRPWLRTS
jgi:predicted nucleic acid-binding protein